ncbi:MAG: DUF502 domain-containing protein [Ferruginibacter sp.]
MQYSFNYKKLFQYFLQGVLILAPISITIWAITAAFNLIDDILPNMFHSIAPGYLVDSNGNIKHIPGVGFILIIGFAILVGYISSSYIVNKVVMAFDHLLQRTPGIKFIYSTIKDFFEAFAGEKKKFTNNVLANVDDNDVWRIGFITRDDMHEFGLNDYVAVYVPMAYSVAGSVYIIPKERIKPITNISAAQTMKFAVSGGVTDVEEEIKIH